MGKVRRRSKSLRGRKLFFLPSVELKRVHGLELAEGLDRWDVFLLRASAHPGLTLLRLLPLHEWLLLGHLHAPWHYGRIDCRCSVHLLVLGGSHVRSLDRQDHGVHQILGGLDEGSSAVQLKERRHHSQVTFSGFYFTFPQHILGCALQCGVTLA